MLSDTARSSWTYAKPTIVGDQKRRNANYLEWKPRTPTESALILEGWERDDSAGKLSQEGTRQPQQTNAQGNMDYWQYY